MNQLEKGYGGAILRGFHLALCSATLFFAMQAPALAQSTRTHHVRQAVARGQATFLNCCPLPSPCASTLFCRCRDQAGWKNSCKSSTILPALPTATS